VKRRLLDTLSRLRASGARHFSAVSCSDAGVVRDEAGACGSQVGSRLGHEETSVGLGGLRRERAAGGEDRAPFGFVASVKRVWNELTTEPESLKSIGNVVGLLDQGRTLSRSVSVIAPCVSLGGIGVFAFSMIHGTNVNEHLKPVNVAVETSRVALTLLDQNEYLEDTNSYLTRFVEMQKDTIENLRRDLDVERSRTLELERRLVL